MAIRDYYNRIVVTTKGGDFGKCLGVHTSWLAASKAQGKDEREYGLNGVELHETDATVEKLVKGDFYPHLADELVVERRELKCIRLMRDVFEIREGTNEKHTTMEIVAIHLDDLKLTVEQLEEQYGAKAQAAIDADAARDQKRAEQQVRVDATVKQVETERSEYTYSFPAVCGIQAGKAFYTAQVPYKALVKLFSFDEEYIPPQLRAQRVLNETRAKKIGEYIVDNLGSYVLPAITASVDQAMTFEPVTVPGASDRLGMLHIPMDATLLINDGQHRRRGIEHAIKSCPPLKDETVCVTMFFDQGLKYSQQMFADINNNAVKPSGAINAVYDHRCQFSQWVLQLLDKVPDIKARVDMENGSVSGKSMKLWSIVPFRKFIGALFNLNAKNFPGQQGESPERIEKLEELFVTLMDEAASHIPSWEAMVNFGIPAYEVRDNLIIGHAVFLESLAVALNALILHQRSDTLDLSPMAGLRKISVSRASPTWENRCVVLGKMQKTGDGVNGTAAVLMKAMGLALPPDMRLLDESILGMADVVDRKENAA